MTLLGTWVYVLCIPSVGIDCGKSLRTAPPLWRLVDLSQQKLLWVGLLCNFSKVQLVIETWLIMHCRNDYMIKRLCG